MAHDLDPVRAGHDATFPLWRDCPTLLWLRVARSRSPVAGKTDPIGAAPTAVDRAIWEALTSG